MELFMSILLLLGGVGVFLAGMKTMSSGISQSAGSGLKRLFKKISSNRFAGYGVGIGATIIVQSSSATSVMSIGLANAGIINSRQGSSIILGAKVGTTLTAFLFALSGLSKGGFSTGILFASMAFAGTILQMISNKDKVKNFATFLLGFGMLFLGLEVMGLSIGGADSTLGLYFKEMFAYDVFKNPVLLILIGMVFTGLVIQSSTAATAIFITFLTTGVLSSVDQSFFLVLGANIGTCSDGVMASLGGSAEGKRLALFHILSSTMGALTFGIITAIFRAPIVEFFDTVIVRPEWGLAIYNLSYNIIYTLLLMPLLNPLVKLMKLIIKDKTKQAEEQPELKYINSQIMRSPILALSNVKREILQMGRLAADNLSTAFDALISGDLSNKQQVTAQENAINHLNREISSYLIKLSSVLSSESQESKIDTYHHVINDIERIGDHAQSLMNSAVLLAEKEDRFTDETYGDLRAMYDKVSKALALSYEIFETRDIRKLKEMSDMEKSISAMQKEFSTVHFRRLTEQSGWAEIQIYYDVISEFERIADHAVKIAFGIAPLVKKKQSNYSR